MSLIRAILESLIFGGKTAIIIGIMALGGHYKISLWRYLEITVGVALVLWLFAIIGRMAGTV